MLRLLIVLAVFQVGSGAHSCSPGSVSVSVFLSMFLSMWLRPVGAGCVCGCSCDCGLGFGWPWMRLWLSFQLQLLVFKCVPSHDLRFLIYLFRPESKMNSVCPKKKTAARRCCACYARGNRKYHHGPPISSDTCHKLVGRSGS